MASYYTVAWFTIAIVMMAWIMHWRFTSVLLQKDGRYEARDVAADRILMMVCSLSAVALVVIGMGLEYSQDITGDMVVDGLTPGELVKIMLGIASAPFAAVLFLACLAGYRATHPARNYHDDFEDEHPFTP